MRPAFSRIASALAATLTLGCVEAGRPLPNIDPTGAAALILVRDGVITGRFDLRAHEGRLVLPVDGQTKVYFVKVSALGLSSVHRTLDMARVGELAIVDAPPDLLQCGHGVLASPSPTPSIDYALRGLAEVSLIEDGERVPLSEWLEVLDTLAVRVPVLPCRAQPATVRPFASKVPFVAPNDVLGRIPITIENLDLTGVSEVAYVGPDTALVALPRSVLLMARGAPLEEAELIDLVDPERQLLVSEPGLDTTLLRLVRRPSTSSTGANLFVALLGHLEMSSGSRAGFSVMELAVLDGRFASSRLIHREPTVSVDPGGLTLGDGDEFAVALLNRVFHRVNGESRPLESSPNGEIMGLSLSHVSAPNLVLGLRPPEWLESRSGALGRFDPHRLPVASSISDHCGEFLRFEHGGRQRLFCGSSHPALFERGAEGWEERPIWYPENLMSCSSASRSCGRAEVQRQAEVERLVVAPGDRLAVLFRGCPGVILAPIDGERCAEFIEIDPAQFAGNRPEIRLRRIDRLDQRLLIGGDGGMLVEVELH